MGLGHGLSWECYRRKLSIDPRLTEWQVEFTAWASALTHKGATVAVLPSTLFIKGGRS